MYVSLHNYFGYRNEFKKTQKHELEKWNCKSWNRKSVYDFFNQYTKTLYLCKGDNHLKQSSRKEIWIQVLGNNESKIRINGQPFILNWQWVLNDFWDWTPWTNNKNFKCTFSLKNRKWIFVEIILKTSCLVIHKAFSLS